jgi:hypothetical protein
MGRLLACRVHRYLEGPPGLVALDGRGDGPDKTRRAVGTLLNEAACPRSFPRAARTVSEHVQDVPG